MAQEHHEHHAHRGHQAHAHTDATAEPTLDTEEESPELKDFSRRIWWTLPFTVVVALLAIFGHRLGLSHGKHQSWVELFLSLPTLLWAGLPIYVRGWQSVVNRSPHMWTLLASAPGPRLSTE